MDESAKAALIEEERSIEATRDAFEATGLLDLVRSLTLP